MLFVSDACIHRFINCSTVRFRSCAEMIIKVSTREKNKWKSHIILGVVSLTCLQVSIKVGVP